MAIDRTRPIEVHQLYERGLKRHHIDQALQHHLDSCDGALPSLGSDELEAHRVRLSERLITLTAQRRADAAERLAAARARRERIQNCLRAVRAAFDASGGPGLAVWSEGERGPLEKLGEALEAEERRVGGAVFAPPDPNGPIGNSITIVLEEIKLEQARRATTASGEVARLKAQLADLGVSL